VSVARRPAYLAGERTIAGYVGDLKVLPSHRRTRLAHRLLHEVERLESVAAPALYAGTTAAGNRAALGLVLRFGEDYPVARIDSFVSYQLLPLFGAGAGRDFTIGRARDEDEDELAIFLDDAHRSYTFGPVFQGGAFRELLARSPGMSLSDYWLARRAGRLVAALGIWDQHGIKRTHVLRMTPPLRWVSAAMRAGSPFGLPRLPREGDALRFRYVRHPAGDPRALAAILKGALAETRARKEHFLLFTCAEGDPIARCVAGMARTTYRYGLVAGKNRPCEERELRALTAALPFDDAALA
jgi:hypothetical protein